MSTNVIQEYMLLNSPAEKETCREKNKGWRTSMFSDLSSGNARSENESPEHKQEWTEEELNRMRRTTACNWLHTALSENEFFIHKQIPMLFILCAVIALPFSRRWIMWFEGSIAIAACAAGRWAISVQNRLAIRYYQLWLCFVVGVVLATLPLLIKSLKASSIIIMLLMGLHIYQALLIHKSLNGCISGDLSFGLTTSRDMDAEEDEELNTIEAKESYPKLFFDSG